MWPPYQRNPHGLSLYCATCRKYEANIQPLKNFRRDWIASLTNQMTSNLIDHSTSDVYKAAMAKLKVECSRTRGATSTTIGRFLSSMDDTQQGIAKKFDVDRWLNRCNISFAISRVEECLELNFKYVDYQTLAHLSYSSCVCLTSVRATRAQRFLSVWVLINTSKSNHAITNWQSGPQISCCLQHRH